MLFEAGTDGIDCLEYELYPQPVTICQNRSGPFPLDPVEERRVVISF